MLFFELTDIHVLCSFQGSCVASVLEATSIRLTYSCCLVKMFLNFFAIFRHATFLQINTFMLSYLINLFFISHVFFKKRGLTE